LAEPTGGHEEIVDVGRRGRRYRRWPKVPTVAEGTDGGCSTSNPIGSTLIRASSVTHRATSR